MMLGGRFSVIGRSLVQIVIMRLHRILAKASLSDTRSLESATPRDRCSTRRINGMQNSSSQKTMESSGSLVSIGYAKERKVSKDSINKIAADFQRKMKKLGLGVQIKAGNGEWVTIVDKPKKRSAESSGRTASTTDGK